MGKTKRIFSFLVALLVVLTIVPVNAIVWAIDANEATESTPDKFDGPMVTGLPNATVSKVENASTPASYEIYDINGKKVGVGTSALNPQVVMQFVAQDTAEEAAQNDYAEYVTDFYISIDGVKSNTYGDGCYLVGYYESWGWAIISLDGVEISNAKYPVITSVGKEFTYADICKDVKDFTCGIYFSEDFLAANPGVSVSLELGLSETLAEAQKAQYIPVGEKYTYTASDLGLPNATVSVLPNQAITGYEVFDIINEKYLGKNEVDTLVPQVLMQFDAKDSAEAAANNMFAQYIADFYVKVDNLAQATKGTGCYLIGRYENFGDFWVAVPLDSMTVESGKNYPVITAVGAEFTYADICKSVQSFQCGIYFSDEFLAANPDMTVSLELGLSKTLEAAQNANYTKIGNTYTYGVEDLSNGFSVIVPDDLTGDIVEEIKDNVALDVYEPENVPEGAELVIELVSVEDKIVFEVAPMANDVKVENLEKAITFRLPVPASVTEKYAKVYHEGEYIGTYTINGTGNAKYVEISSKDFSKFALEPVAEAPAATVNGVEYDTLQAAINAANENDVVVLCKDVVINSTLVIAKSITLDGNGYALIPADGASFSSVIMVGDSGWGDDHGESVVIKDLTISGFTAQHGIVRAQGVTLTMSGCVLNENTVTNAAYAVVSLNYTDALIESCEFSDNNDRVIDMNYNADNSKSVVEVKACTFDNNTTDGAGIIYRNAGGKITITSCEFTNNTINTTGNAAIVYTGWGKDSAEITGCYFADNTVTSSSATTKRFAGAIFVDSGIVNGNVFVNNVATRGDGTAMPTVSVGAFYGGADVSGNYWDGNEPNYGVEFSNEVTNNGYYTEISEDGAIMADSYVSNIAYVAEVNGVGYATLLEALAAAQSGDTVKLLGDLTLAAGDIDYRLNIKIPAGVTFDGGNYTLVIEQVQDCDYAAIWSDGAYTVQNITIKVMGEREACRTIINFSKGGTLKNATLWSTVLDIGVNYDKPADGMTLLVENCEIYTGAYAFYADPSSATVNVTLKNNTITANRFGSMQYSENVIGNILTDTCDKGISLGASFTGTVTGNEFYGDRALSVYGNQTISGNVISANSIVELNNGAVANLSGNYWGGEAPSASQIVADKATSVVSFTVDNYYADEELTQLVSTANYVAQVGEQKFESVIEAILYAAENGAEEVKLLADSREVMPTDVEIILNADLTITADTAVKVEFYNNGTSYDFVIDCKGYGDYDFTIAENVNFVLEDRVIWVGFYGSNIDVVVNGTLSGSQIWAGGDIYVNKTGTLKSTGEAFVIRRGKTVFIDGGKVEANYFNILSGNIKAENGAVIESGALWIDNTGGYAGEGAVSITLWDSTLTVKGNLESSSSNFVEIDIYDSVVTITDVHGYGVSVLDANTTLYVNGENGSLTINKGITNNGTIDVYDGGELIIPNNAIVTNNGSILLDEYSTIAGPANMGVETEATNKEVEYVDGKYVVVTKKVYVAQIGDVKYETLQEAVNAAQVGDEIVLLADINCSTVTIAGKKITLDLNGKVISGVCNTNQSSLIYIENDAKLTVKDSAGEGKITYAQGSANQGWTIDVKGKLVLESGTIELTGNAWSIGYAVDVRPNAWGKAYTYPTAFVMNGGNVISSDGAVRVASSSSDAHKNVSASFEMNGGYIDAAWDGVFIQQSNGVYDDLSFTMNGGTIESDLNPIRVYGPAPTGYVNDKNCMSITLADGTMTYTGTETYTWVIDGILRVGGGSTVETLLENSTLAVSAAVAENATAPEGYKWTANNDGTYSLVKKPPVNVKFAGATVSFDTYLMINLYIEKATYADVKDIYAVVQVGTHEAYVIKYGEKSKWSVGSNGYPYDALNISGISAKEMGDNVNVQFFSGNPDDSIADEKLGGEINYSVETYAYIILNGNYTFKAKRAMYDLLEYGAAAQIYFKYKTDDLVNAGLVDFSDYARKSNEQAKPDKTNNVITGKEYLFGHTASLDDSLVLNYYFLGLDTEQYKNKLVAKATYVGWNGQTQTIYGSFVYGQAYGRDVTMVSIKGLSGGDVYSDITLELYDESNTVVFKSVYSVEAYLKTMIDSSPNYAYLYQAVANYGESVKAYLKELNGID